MAPRKYTEARKENNKKWDAENLDRISVAAPKGTKERWKFAAEKENKSLNQFIVDTVNGGIKMLSDKDIVDKLRKKLKKHGLKIHKLKEKDFMGNDMYQVLEESENPKDHAEDEFNVFKLDKLITCVEELEEEAKQKIHEC